MIEDWRQYMVGKQKYLIEQTLKEDTDLLGSQRILVQEHLN